MCISIYSINTSSSNYVCHFSCSNNYGSDDAISIIDIGGKKTITPHYLYKRDEQFPTRKLYLISNKVPSQCPNMTFIRKKIFTISHNFKFWSKNSMFVCVLQNNNVQ